MITQYPKLIRGFSIEEGRIVNKRRGTMKGKENGLPAEAGW